MKRTIYFNAQIITMEENGPYAQAMLIEDGLICKVGTNEEILSFQKEETKCIDLNQRVILPSFIDSHSHISSMIFHYLMIDIGPDKCKSIEELTEVLKQSFLEEPPKEKEWLIGWGYDNSIFEEEKHPTKYDLNKVSTSIPIIIMHASGQCAVCNSPALKAFGYVGKDFKVPSGGIIEKVKGDTTGLIKGNALYDKDTIPFPPVEKIIQAFQKAVNEYVSNGITTVLDAKTGGLEYILLKNLSDLNAFHIDVVSYVTKEASKKLLSKRENPFVPYRNRYRIGGYKIVIDGSPHLKTAWLSEPYYIVPENKSENYRGFPIKTDEEVEDECKMCIDNSWQINAHCNGDAACDQFIHAYEKTLKESLNNKNLRTVIVHAQIIRDDQLDKMKELDMIPTFFLDHIYYNGDYYYESVLGTKRAMKLSPLKAAMNRNLFYTIHQNAPVIAPNVLFSVHNAVNRVTKSGRLLGEEEIIPIEEALKAVTINAAYQIFEEDQKGSIKQGKLADFIILNKNPLYEEKSKIKEILVLETIKEGITVYKREI
jgi:predicted amidohydrolase YtcJ